MYKIGVFSKMCKVTIKALRYYEKEGLLKPAYIDENNSYRYYDSSQLVEISKIIALKQIGLSINDIKKIIKENKNFYDVLKCKKNELEKNINLYNYQLSQINYLLEEKKMENEILVKEIPSYVVYYREGIIKNYEAISEFVLETGKEVTNVNPNLKCIEPGYCYVNYLDHGYKEENVKIRYVEAVQEMGKESENIKFTKSNSIKAVCIYHKGSYSKLGESYNKILKYVENNGYEIAGEIRESYIDGCWNKESEEDYLTELQVPIEIIK